jgi:hypothetical protein
MGVAERTAYDWARKVKLTIAERYERICSDDKLVQRWEGQFKATRAGTNARTRVLAPHEDP